MELAIYLARVWGLFLFLACLGLLVNRKSYLQVLKTIENGVLLVGGVLALGVGALQVAGFEVWSFSWQGLITLLGWASLIKGFFILFIPGYKNSFLGKAVQHKFYTVSLVVGLILGLYLLYIGYLVY